MVGAMLNIATGMDGLRTSFWRQACPKNLDYKLMFLFVNELLEAKGLTVAVLFLEKH